MIFFSILVQWDNVLKVQVSTRPISAILHKSNCPRYQISKIYFWWWWWSWCWWWWWWWKYVLRGESGTWWLVVPLLFSYFIIMTYIHTLFTFRKLHNLTHSAMMLPSLLLYFLCFFHCLCLRFMILQSWSCSHIVFSNHSHFHLFSLLICNPLFSVWNWQCTRDNNPCLWWIKIWWMMTSLKVESM